MPRSRRHEIGVGVLVLAALALLAYMSLQVGALKSMGNTISVTAVFTDAAGLADGAAVKVAGVEVGKVLRMRVEHDRALIELQLRANTELRADVVAQVRARSVLGEKYVELTPQSTSAPLLGDGDRITDTRGATEIDQLVNSLGPLVQSMNPDEVSGALKVLTDAIQRDPERVDRLLADLETLLHNAAVASEQAPALVDDTRAAIADTRAALRDVRQVANDTRPVIAHADELLARIDESTVELPEAVSEVRGLVGEAREAVVDGRRVMGDLEGSTGDVKRILANLSEIDKWELRRLLREEGILVRMKADDVQPDEQAP